jgi:hypothetical protein
MKSRRLSIGFDPQLRRAPTEASSSGEILAGLRFAEWERAMRRDPAVKEPQRLDRGA